MSVEMRSILLCRHAEPRPSSSPRSRRQRRRRPSRARRPRRRRLPRPAPPVTASRAYRPSRTRRRWPASRISSPSTSSSSCATASRKPGVMQAIVKTLTDENIRDLGAYYAALPPPPPFAEGRPVDADKVNALMKPRRCDNCHKEDFSGQGETGAAGRAAAGLSDQVPEGLSLRRTARARHGRDDGGVGHPAGRRYRHDRRLSGAQALTHSLNPRPHHPRPLPRRTAMAWKTPRIVEIAVGMEINSYACADLVSRRGLAPAAATSRRRSQ